ncbi:MAG: CgeB family protein [Planctomycetota bacterium]|jgi:hypothetical protein
MRILLIGPFAEGLLAESYARAFARLGHEVFRFDADRAYVQAAWYAGNRWARRLLRRPLWQRVNLSTVEVARCVRPAFVLAFKGAYLHAETVRRVRDEGSIPFINYYPDNPYCGVPLDPRKTSAQRRDLLEVLRQYDRVYTWERGLVARLESDGVRAAYLPFGADLEACSSTGTALCPDCGTVHEVVFIGQHNAKRERHVGLIARHDVGLWGSRWRRAAARFRGRHTIHQRPAFGQSCAALYRGAAVSLNVLDDLNMPGHNMRTFEIPASGGLMLSTFTESQAEFFPEEEAAWYYRDPEELDAILKRLLADGRLRRRTRQCAIAIACRHDYLHRAESILSDLGLGAGSAPRRALSARRRTA